MKYDIAEFMRQFPNDEACLKYVFKHRYPELSGYHRVKGTMAFGNKSRYRIYPLQGTILEKTRTPLTKWFYALYIFHISKNGVSAKELERHFGVTYKTAWRMASKIRGLMKPKRAKLSGVVEADETYVGGRRRSSNWWKPKVVVLGVVQRGGKIKVKKLKDRSGWQIIPYIEKNVKKDSTIYTDEAPVYKSLMNYKRGTVKHGAGEYVKGDVHTNTIEGFWGQFKRSLNGTYHFVSERHLQAYIDEFCFRYNYRDSSFDELIRRI